MSPLACRFTICVIPPRRFFNNRMKSSIIILFHQSNVLALIELAHAIHEDLLQLLLRESLVGADASDVLSPLFTEEP